MFNRFWFDTAKLLEISPPKKRYAEAVRWAASEGIVKGLTEVKFAPNDTVTRAQAVAFLARLAGVSRKENDAQKQGG